MPPRTTVKLKRAQRRVQVAELHLKGWTHRQIAARLGIDSATIRHDLAHLRRDWQTSAIGDFHQAQQQELARLAQVEREAWSAWDDSKRDLVTTKVSKEGDENRSKQRAEQTTRGQSGNPRYLDVIQRCIERRCKMFGLDVPLRRVEEGGQIDAEALRALREELLSEEAYLEFQRQGVAQADLLAGPVRAPRQRRPMEDGQAPGKDR